MPDKKCSNRKRGVWKGFLAGITTTISSHDTIVRKKMTTGDLRDLDPENLTTMALIPITRRETPGYMHTAHDRQPDQKYRPRSRTPPYDQRQPDQKYRHRSDSPPAKRPRTTDLEQMKDLAKILNIAPEKMTEAYDVISQVIQHQKNN